MTQDGVSETPDMKTRILTRLMHSVFIWTRGMTLGVRAACFDAHGRVFLVRHTYVPGWYLPGGGVEHGETMHEALAKELREEGNLEMTAPPELFHAYLNRKISRRDHVMLYRVQVRQVAPRLPDREIAESGFFLPEEFPAGVTSATLRRVAELRGEAVPDGIW